MRDSTLVLGDGRTLAYTEIGSTDTGAPVVAYFHGAPTSRLDLAAADEEATAMGARVISADRPGYGGSSPNPGRTIADHVTDVIALLDELGVDRFGVVGTSSGGPYALACASVHQPRVSRAAVIAGVTNFGWDGAWDGFEPTEDAIMRQPDEDAAVQWVTEHFGADGSGFFAAEMPEVEVATMAAADPAVADSLMASVIEAFAQGVDGYARDIWQQGRPWTFDVGAITAPLRVCHGDLDALAPLAHAERNVSLVPGAELVVWPGTGHMGAALRAPEVLAELLA